MPEQQMSKPEESLRALQLYEGAKCDGASLKDTTDKGICALAKSKKYTEMARLSRFAEELGKKFLSTLGEERFKTEDPLKLLKLLEKERPDWKEIMKRFNKAKDYEVKAAAGDTPAMIIFKYTDGKTEEYNLELSFRYRSALAGGLSSALQTMLDNQKIDKTDEKTDDEKPEEQIDKIKRFYEVISTSRLLNSPQAAYNYLINYVYLPQPVLKKLCKPLSKIAGLFANAKIDEKTGEISGIDENKYEAIGKEIRDIYTNLAEVVGRPINEIEKEQDEFYKMAQLINLPE